MCVTLFVVYLGDAGIENPAEHRQELATKIVKAKKLDLVLNMPRNFEQISSHIVLVFPLLDFEQINVGWVT